MSDKDIIDTIENHIVIEYYAGAFVCDCGERFSVAGRKCRHWAEHLLDTIAAAGFAIVELPEPADGEWVIQGIGNVATYAWDGSPLPTGGVRVTNIGYDLELHATKARELAAALLAAADKAEEDAMRISNRQRVIETTCEYLAAGNCASSVDGYCIGGTSDGQCHG